MSSIEAEAREALSRRRRLLTKGPARLSADPEARWLDHDGAPPTPGEAVRREMAEIDAALARIAEGRYGVCLACGGPMGLQRLRAIPEARYCVSCAGQPRDE